MDDSSVRVAVRIRPRVPRETIDGCQICTTVTPGVPQIWMGGNHGFTFDYVLDSDISQEEVFPIVQELVDGCLDGYNATILAYGQTGSGKTYTMGTGFDTEHLTFSEVAPSQGIIPRAVHHLFTEISRKRQEAMDRQESPPEFTVKAQFVELHNEEINDLIASDLKVYRQGKSAIKIREDPSGLISMLGIETKSVNSAADTMACLRDGALVRSTASTNMNDSSSRSHAIFTLHIYQQRIVKADEKNDEVSNGPEFETLSAKFHFVDLAGSERLKRTGAVGERAKEGISINCGLLALGNVISALGDKAMKASHIPYRNSKLTRLLQDSLGGNSRTIMIACISPCDRDFVETLNTLKYANRTRNIKNKVTVNQDKSSRIIANLKQELLRLEEELQAYKQGRITGNGVVVESDLYQENLMLSSELERLRSRVKILQESLDRVTASNAALLADRACEGLVSSPEGSSDISSVIRKYALDIEELRAKLFESEAMVELLKRKQSTSLLNQSLSPRTIVSMSCRPGTAYDDLEASLHENDLNSKPSIRDIISTAQTEIMEHESQRLKLEEKLRRKAQNARSNDIDDTNGNDDQDTFSSDDSGSEGDFEDEGAEGSLQEEIANINDQINTKQRLIEQLELSNKRALDTKEQYEQQIQILVTKIKHTEDERDKVLNGLKPSPQTTGKVKQVKDEYEAKVSELERELIRMKNALKEHNVLVRKNAATEKQVATLKSEVDSMKRLKVKLQNQMKEENVKFRETDAKRMREILQLKKDQRKKDVQIRALESKDKLKEQIIRRKLEEVTALKKQNKSVLSRRAAGKVAVGAVTHRRAAKAKKKWDELKSAFCQRDADRKLMEQLESEMLRHITNRKQANEEIEQIKNSIALGGSSLSGEEINQMNDEIDTLTASVIYSDEQVSQSQRAICELTSASPKSSDQQQPDISLAMDHFTKEDCEYLMQKMYSFTMENVLEYKETSTKLSLVQQENQSLARELATANELLSHMFTKYCVNDPNLSPDLTLKINNVRASNRNRLVGIINSATTLEAELNGCSLGNAIAPSGGSCPTSPITSSGRRFAQRQTEMSKDDEKAGVKDRRLTFTRKELMADLLKTPIAGAHAAQEDGFVRPVVPGPLFRSSSTRLPSTRTKQVQRRETFVVSRDFDGVYNGAESTNVTSSTQSKQSLVSRKANALKSQRPYNPVPVNNIPSSKFSLLPTENFNADTTFIVDPVGSISAPGSPGATRKLGNENVFQRLTSSTCGANVEATIQEGSIRGIRERASQKSPFLLTHIADGHAKAVLDVYATEDRLFTSGKDTSVKIWDLQEMREIATLLGPPTNITRVKFCESSHLLFCATACYVRVCDMRTNTCIKTLSSSGICHNTEPATETFLQFPHKEQQITAIAVCENSNSLYTSYGQMVRLWDLRSFTSLGVIAGKHQSQVMCMETESGRGYNTLVTGSKDHCIKVYTYNSAEPFMNIAVPPKATLNPPHYDGIESFALSGRTLFSGSRDNCIKKWDLKAKPEFLLAYNNAHGNWISGLCLPPSHPQYLVSASRDGTMKVWNTESTRAIGVVEAHKGGVNCLTSNKSTIFTGSNEDGTVAFWRLRNLTESSGESSPVHGSPEGSA